MPSIDWEKVGGQGGGLLTVVVQDTTTKEILMVVYMNQKAYVETGRSGWLTLFSRKTQELRVQGESRGCRLRVFSTHVSCEGNALLVQVGLEGNRGDVCHHGGRSCFA